MSSAIQDARLLEHFIVRGYLHDLQQPCLHLQLQLRPLKAELVDVISRLDRALDRQLIPMPEGMQPRLIQVRRSAESSSLPLQAQVWPFVEALNQLLVRLQETAGLPVACGIRCEGIARGESREASLLAVLAIPSLSPEVVRSSLPWALEQISAIAYEEQATLKGLDAELKKFERQAPGGINNRLLLKAAYQYGVPVTALPGRVFQYGSGARSRWMDSTFTDITSIISARLARSKVAANALLRRAGLPVPQQVVVRSIEAALAQARLMGYPVVVKPSDLDGGKGVSAGIEDEDTLRRSYARAAAHSKNLVLEKHIPGNDFRLGIVHGQLAWATWREPAGVWGDGVNSIGQLVAIANRDPRRGTQKWSNMRPLTIDAEVQEILQAQGLHADSTLAPGQFARFRRTSNISAGGTPTNMMGKVHPDNIALAVRAADILRLDFAGIDLITPDVTKSWLEMGGAICEINGQPQFSVIGPQAPRLAIRGLLQGDGRIPIVVVLTAEPAHALMQAVDSASLSRGLALGCSTELGLSMGGAVIRCGRQSAFEDAQALLLNTQVQAMAVVTDGAEWLRTGTPFDALDLLLVADDTPLEARHVLQMRCKGEVWKLKGGPALDGGDLATRLADRLVACDAQHRSADLCADEDRAWQCRSAAAWAGGRESPR
ncbi:MAG: cyanophycin synthetase [Rubrivivax sp.]|nr:cyanophycin synthetase [Rubrivivax sp.]